MNNQMTVLIADESADFGKACQRELKQVGFDVVAVKKDGRRVIDALETKHFDAVLMDVFMSGLDGIEVLEYIKDSLSEPPIVMCFHRLTAQSLKAVLFLPVRIIIFSNRLNLKRLQRDWRTYRTGKEKGQRLSALPEIPNWLYPILCAKSEYLLILRAISI